MLVRSPSGFGNAKRVRFRGFLALELILCETTICITVCFIGTVVTVLQTIANFRRFKTCRIGFIIGVALVFSRMAEKWCAFV